MDKNIFSNDLIELLKGGQAHLGVKSILNRINPKLRHVRPQKNISTIYEELEHMRIAQEDILQFMFNETWESPPWPEGYWPPKDKTVSEQVWATKINLFLAELDKLIKFIWESNIDLTLKIPHGDGQTYLREVLLVADHNAYHLGQIVQIQKLLRKSPD